ncbi:DUF7711 family protein [Actinomycetospora aeridis]|uniref:DUF7711 domain-containing protein n=1 Tax=Actinomycetospora aeridis TaxID=3129231 RepID=A0ABU8N2X8_9PSEU
MKHGTAVRHLAELAEEASRQARVRADNPNGWPLASLWAAGAVLGSGEDTEVLMVLDVPAVEAPWLALHPAGDRVADVLELSKRPLLWSSRPEAWPAWNARHRRVLRFWSEDGGANEEALEALRRRSPTISEPSREAWQAQLRRERSIARHHLDAVLDRFHEPDWRRSLRGTGRRAEEHLWGAAQGLREIDEALEA